MKTIIKLLVAAVILHAGYRMGAAYWAHYQWEDALQEICQFGGAKTVKVIHDEAMAKAAEFKVPVPSESVTVRKTDRELFIEAAYVRQVQLFPTYYYPWDFKLAVKAWTRPY